MLWDAANVLIQEYLIDCPDTKAGNDVSVVTCVKNNFLSTLIIGAAAVNFKLGTLVVVVVPPTLQPENSDCRAHF